MTFKGCLRRICHGLSRLIVVPGGGVDFAVTRMVIGAIMISFSGVWVKVSHVTPTVSAFYRVLFGGLFLLIAASIRREIRWFGRRHLMLGMLCSLFFAFNLVCYHISIRYVGPGLGTMLPNFQVFILAAVGVLFLGEGLRLRTVMAMPVAVGGLLLIVGIDWQGFDAAYRLGIFAGLAAAVFYSVFLLSLRRFQSGEIGRSIYRALMFVCLLTACLIGLEVLRTGDSFQIPDQQTLWALMALGILSQAIGWILITGALPHVRAALSGLVLLLQPALAFIWDVLFFGRPTSLVNWVGAAMVLIAIYLGAARSVQKGDP